MTFFWLRKIKPRYVHIHVNSFYFQNKKTIILRRNDTNDSEKLQFNADTDVYDVLKKAMEIFKLKNDKSVHWTIHKNMHEPPLDDLEIISNIVEKEKGKLYILSRQISTTVVEPPSPPTSPTHKEIKESSLQLDSKSLVSTSEHVDQLKTLKEKSNNKATPHSISVEYMEEEEVRFLNKKFIRVGQKGISYEIDTSHGAGG